jgi:hypothetical protein
MVTAADIKADLPNWPDQVIEDWLLHHANRGAEIGWPPPNDVNFHPWGPIIGWRPLSWWKDVSWTLEEHEIGFDSLCNDSKQAAIRIADEINKDEAQDNSDARFESAAKHLTSTGEFHTPLVVMKQGDGLSVLDGNHRVTALISCQAQAEAIKQQGGKVPSTKQKIWMGSHAKGQVPLDCPDI